MTFMSVKAIVPLPGLSYEEEYDEPLTQSHWLTEILIDLTSTSSQV